MSAHAALQSTAICRSSGAAANNVRGRANRRATVTRVAARPVAAAASDVKSPLVKVCGVTTVEDAKHAAEAGANFIGMILWPKSKRSIDLDIATDVAAAAKEAGATPVGVFVDESAEEIIAGGFSFFISSLFEKTTPGRPKRSG